MHLLQCLLAGLIILLVGTILLVRYSSEEDPTEKDNKVREMFPFTGDPDDAQLEDNTPIWRIRKTQNN